MTHARKAKPITNKYSCYAWIKIVKGRDYHVSHVLISYIVNIKSSVSISLKSISIKL